MQLPEDSPLARQIGQTILAALGRTPLFIAAALPLKIFPPLFNRYQGGERFDTHVDNAIRVLKGSEIRVRSDLSATLFLSDPDDYRSEARRVGKECGRTCRCVRSTDH